MKRNIYCTVLTVVFSLNFTFCQKNEYSAFLIPSSLKENANAVVRDNSIEITIEDVDRMFVKKREVVTVLNKLGIVDARIAEGYDNDTKITDLSAIIYDAFGNEIKKYKERDFIDVSAVSGGTLYSDARVKYVEYTPISYPYTLVFESKYKTSTTGFIPSWFPINGYHISVEKSKFLLKNPKGIKWRRKETNFEGFDIDKISSDIETSYLAKNEKALKYEDNATSYRDMLPKATVALNRFSLKGVLGDYSNWKEFGFWMSSKLLNGRNALEESTKIKIKNLVKGVENPIERAKIVYQFMQNKTRYISVQVGIGGWEPIAANQVDKMGYGDCKGLTNYTKSLMDVAGVESYYTIVYADEKRDIDKEFSSIQGNHIILNIPNKGNDVWLECTSQTMPFGFLGDFTDDRNVLVVTPEGGLIKRTSIYKGEENLQIIKGTIQLDTLGNVKASLERVSKGLQFDDKSYYERYTEEELIKNYKSSVWNYNNNLEIESVKLKNDKENIVFTEYLGITVKNYAAINEQEYLFRVNIFNKNNFVPKRYRTRKLPLKISRGYKDVDEYEISIPDGYLLSALPLEKVLTTKFGTYKVAFTKINDTTFKYHKTMIIKEGVYPKEDYKIYRRFRKSIAKYESLRIAIIKK
jgi:ribosome-binding ATPase YchF (GTP1/OBG family)